MQRITTFLWFDTQAEEAARFYISIFRNSTIVRTVHLPEGGPGPAGSVLTVDFELDGQPFVALNGGPGFPFTQAISLMVNCDSQQEIDYYWEKLLDGGKPIQCGWLQDRYGLSWQVTPTALLRMLSDPDQARAGRVMQAMMQMVKLDLPALERAYADAGTSART